MCAIDCREIFGQDWSHHNTLRHWSLSLLLTFFTERLEQFDGFCCNVGLLFLKFFNHAVTPTMASGKMGSLDDIKRILDGHVVERWYTVVVSLFYNFQHLRTAIFRILRVSSNFALLLYVCPLTPSSSH